jgi:hypothetical protein
MTCLSCASNYQGEFAVEMIIHFSGLRNLDKPGVWVFPKLLVCMDCGFSRFTLRKPELAVLTNAASPHETLPLAKCLDSPALKGGITLRLA